ncbi:Stabilin-2 [Orchesella cincta]|uniref:Stabilin-2 n=1 Tax=Orchesella cincta TaxID=48709 RepID=A0A1D2MAL0_ORCCI|nr:Stabilin-2 [Orchesella cincta]
MKSFKKDTSTWNSPFSHISPTFSLPLILAVLLLNNFFVQLTFAQDYMSSCDKVTNPCAADGFFRCISGQCQCQDSLTQIYDDAMSQCVIMAGRSCSLDGEPSADMVDPRAYATFPTCGRNAKCDPTTRTCQCKKGFVMNGENGTCDSSFGRSCSSEDSILFSTGFVGDNNTLASAFGECDTSLGLRCENGKCECGEDQSIWQIGQGCVARGTEPFNGNSNITFSYVNEDMTPFQRLVDTYTRALIDANNNYYFPQKHTEGSNTRRNFTVENYNTVAYPDDLLYNMTWSMGEQNRTDEYFVGDRNQFPNNNGGITTINPLWNLLAQQQQNNISSDNLVQLQAQAAQLQSLLSQQQRIQQLINQFNPTATLNQQGTSSSSSTQQQQKQPGFQTPSPIVGNYLLGQGQGFYPAQPQAPNLFWNPSQQQQQQQPLGGGMFPLLRWFRNIVDPIKRRLFPNLTDAVNSIPSPLFIAARTTHALIPVLRALDQQFTPMLESVIELTKPRPRPTTPQPSIFFNPQQQLLNGNFYPGLLPQYQNQQGVLYGPVNQQRQNFQGRSLWGNRRNGRMRNNIPDNNENILNRKLWWW